MTVRAMASGRLTSPVGGARKPGSPLGTKASQLHTRMKMPTLTPRPTKRRPWGPMAESARSETCSVTVSQKSCSFPGTPEVTLRTMRKPRASTMAAAMSVVHTTSRSIVRPPTCTTPRWSPMVMLPLASMKLCLIGCPVHWLRLTGSPGSRAPGPRWPRRAAGRSPSRSPCRYRAPRSGTAGRWR